MQFYLDVPSYWRWFHHVCCVSLVIISFLVGQWLLESAYDLRIIRFILRYLKNIWKKLPCLKYYSNRRMKFYKTSSYQIEFPYKWKKLFVATLTILVKLFCANIGLLWSVLFPNVTVPPWITIVLSECDLNLFYTYWRRLHTTKHSSGYKWLDYDRRLPRHRNSYMFKNPG